MDATAEHSLLLLRKQIAGADKHLTTLYWFEEDRYAEKEEEETPTLAFLIFRAHQDSRHECARCKSSILRGCVYSVQASLQKKYKFGKKVGELHVVSYSYRQESKYCRDCLHELKYWGRRKYVEDDALNKYKCDPKSRCNALHMTRILKEIGPPM